MPAFSGLFDGVHTTPHVLDETEPGEKRLSHVLREQGMRVIKELMLTVNGTVVGSTALAQNTRAAAFSSPGAAPLGGGLRTMETKDLINRATVAADTTRIGDMLAEIFAPATYPPDLGGNGGGGKLDEQQNL